MSTLADDLQVIAFYDIAADTNGARLRQLYRWYSKTFFTPLDRVIELPLPFILQTFWEERYSHMDREELEEERLRLLETPEERMLKELAQDADQMGTDALLTELEAELAKPASVPQRVEDIKPPAPVRTREKIPEVNLPKPDKVPPLPETVKIQFAPTDFFDELVDRLDSIEPKEDPNLLGKSRKP